MAMAAWYTPWREVLRPEWSAEVRFDLLARLDCLSFKGRSDRPGVVRVIEQAEGAPRPGLADPARPSPGSAPLLQAAPHGVDDEIAGALESAGYIIGWSRVAHLLQFDRPGFDRIIEDVHAVAHATRLVCPGCLRRNPEESSYCGYCGMRLIVPCLVLAPQAGEPQVENR
jgi:hypothetical protein